MYVPIYSNCDNAKLQNDSVTLIFKVGTWFFDATHRLDVVDICAKLILKSLNVWQSYSPDTNEVGQTDVLTKWYLRDFPFNFLAILVTQGLKKDTQVKT
jgi:hypothetical protein